MTHIVRRGESLWSIAQSELGDPRQWPRLAHLNRLEQPFKLLIGQELKLPEQAPSGAGYIAPSFISADPVQAHSTASVLPGRAYLFVMVREVLPNAKLVRKVVPIPETDIAAMIVNRPDLFGFHSRLPGAGASLGEHALGNTLSKYISSSDKPGGAPNFEGRAWYIDIAKAERSGVQIHSTEAVTRDLDRIAELNPALAARIGKLKIAMEQVEGEVLLEGSVPKSAVQTAEAAALELKTLGMMSRGARVLGVIGVVLTVYDLGSATAESVQTQSIKPISAEAIRQVGGWGGAWAGMQMGFMAGAAVGIETGPGALLTGLAGGLFFGAVGFWAGDKVADTISPN